MALLIDILLRLFIISYQCVSWLIQKHVVYPDIYVILNYSDKIILFWIHHWTATAKQKKRIKLMKSIFDKCHCSYNWSSYFNSSLDMCQGHNGVWRRSRSTVSINANASSYNVGSVPIRPTIIAITVVIINRRRGAQNDTPHTQIHSPLAPSSMESSTLKGWKRAASRRRSIV